MQDTDLGKDEADGEAVLESLLDGLLGDDHDALGSVHDQEGSVRQPQRRAYLVVEVDVPCAIDAQPRVGTCARD